jgi:hypothetical protein
MKKTEKYIWVAHNAWAQPEVKACAAALGLRETHVFGCWLQVWLWVDEHGADETGLPPAFFNQLVGVDRLIETSAVTMPTWVRVDERGVEILNRGREWCGWLDDPPVEVA